ncbi:MAG: glucosaminidase domain-containing protein [Thermotogota bacterium]
MKNIIPFIYILFSIILVLIIVINVDGKYSQETTNKKEIISEYSIKNKQIDWDYVYYRDWEDLDNYFNEINFYLDSETIPTIIVERFPNNLNNINDINKKKNTFIKIMLPIIKKVNLTIEYERKQILEGNITEKLIDKYSTEDNDILLRRVQPIPTHIALGQSAKESGWGTSRFAIEGNNIFGEWTWEEGTGIIPSGRPEGEIYEVKKFDSLVDSMESYALKLNTLDYYSDFRKIRNNEINNKRLTEGLLYYSQQREIYIESLSNLIDTNNFKKYNSYSLKNK